MKYGMPYKGSKNKLAEQLINLFPKADNFYDLFCGGCAVAHAALLSHKYKTVHINDIEPKIVDLFVKATKGEFKNETRWISHEDFGRLKDTDFVVVCLFSFGNNYRSYSYNKEIEPMKKAAHYAIFFGDFSYFREWNKETSDKVESALKIIPLSERQKRRLVWQRSLKRIFKQRTQIQQLESLERLERLERLESLERLEILESSSTDYRNIQVKPNSVIYCDIPYENTEKYYKQAVFDYASFYEWCLKQSNPVFISSYNIPDPRFKVVAEFKHCSTLCATENKAVIEKVYMPISQALKQAKPKRKTLFSIVAQSKN